MRTLLISSFLAIGVQCAFAQADTKIWTRLPGSGSDDEGLAVAVDNFGNAIVAGATQGAVASGNAGRYDMWVAKYNSAGTQLWARQRGTSQREYAYGVATDAAGSIYTAGYTGAALDGQTHAGASGDFDVFLMKHDSAGNWQWTREFGFTPDDIGWAVATDRFGYIYITGSVRGALDGLPRPGGADIFIRKYDSNGNKIWSALLGSADVDEGYAIACDNDGNVFVTGYCQGSIEGNTYMANGDNFLAKYDTAGNRVWLKQWGTFNKETGNALATDAAGNVYLAGYTTGTLYSSVRLGERDLFFAKFSPSGDLLWAQQSGSSGHDEAYGIATGPSGDVYVTGKVSGNLDAYDHQGGEDIYLMKYDSAGNWLETFQYGGIWGDIAKGVAVNTNGTIFIAGTTYSTNLDGQTFGGGASDGFVSKFEFSPTAKPCAPKTLVATGATSNSLTANWLIPQGATGCRLDVSTNATFANYLAGYQNLDVGNVTNQNLTGLTPATIYYYRLRAYNTNGTSGNSLTIFVPLAPATSCVGTVNSDFEGGFRPAGGGNIANGWTEWEDDLNSTIGSDETVIVHGGAHAQRLQVSSSGSTSGGVYQRIPVTAGQTYTVSVWIYASDDQTSCSLGVDPAGGTDDGRIGVVWSSVTTNAAWVQKTWTGIPKVHLLTVFYKVASADGSTRTGYFDDGTPADLTIPPQLSIQSVGDSLTLTWPECPPAQLEQTPTLGTGAPAEWTTVTNQVAVGGGQKSVTLTPIPQSGTGYYRLILE